MAFDYSASAATAAALLDNFGQTVTLTRTTEPAYDPITGAYTPGGTTTASAKAALFDYTLQESGAQFADGSVIRVGDKKILIQSGLAFAPDEMTTVTDASGVAWKIDNVRVLAPAGTPVLYIARGWR